LLNIELRVYTVDGEQTTNISMARLFPQLDQPLVGIAKLASQGQALSAGHEVEYLTLENRSVLTRCTSKRVPFTWMINPYRGCEFACKYCYARYTHEFMELRDSRDFERRIFVKQHTAWLLRQELKKVRRGESIAIGTATDPYQPAERKFGITRSILEELARHEGLEIGLVTKGTLILRDMELLRVVAEHNELSICVTVTTMNADLARILEPRAPRPDLRMKIVRQLNAAGIRAGVNCAPILPGITDAPDALDTLVSEAGRAKAAFVFANALFLKSCSLRVFFPFVEKHFPHLLALYRERYSNQAFLPVEYSRRISRLMKKLCAKNGIGAKPQSESAEMMTESKPARRVEQLRLF
jgi:DNA repair photolyase